MKIAAQEAETLFKAIPTVKIMNPPTDVLSPIGEENLLKGLHKQVKAAFYTAVTRPPSVYRGNPFTVEVALAYGVEGWEEDGLMRLVRFANRVHLLYQQGACAVYEAVMDTSWRNYGLSQSKGALGGAHGAGGALRVGVGAVHVGVEGSRRTLPRDHPGDEAGGAGGGPPRGASHPQAPAAVRPGGAAPHLRRYIEEVADALAHLAKAPRRMRKKLQEMAEAATKMEEKAAAKGMEGRRGRPLEGRRRWSSRSGRPCRCSS